MHNFFKKQPNGLGRNFVVGFCIIIFFSFIGINAKEILNPLPKFPSPKENKVNLQKKKKKIKKTTPQIDFPSPKDLNPSIYRPKETKFPPIQFPPKRFIDFLRYLDYLSVQKGKPEKNTKTIPDKKQIVAMLKRSLIKREYIFSSDCPITLLPSRKKTKNTVVFECIPKKYKNRIGEMSAKDVLLSGKSKKWNWIYYPSLTTKRKFTAKLKLSFLSYYNGKIYWNWKIKSIEYINPYLRLLHKRNPYLSESLLLKEKNISKNFIPLLLLLEKSLRDAETKAKTKEQIIRRNLSQFKEIVKEGYVIHIKKCPLVRIAEPKKNPVLLTIESRYKIECISSFLSEVSLVSDYYTLKKNGDLQKLALNRVTADLCYAGIYQKNGHYYLHWSRIKNIHPKKSSDKSTQNTENKRNGTKK